MGLHYGNRFVSQHLGRPLLHIGYQELPPLGWWERVVFFFLLWFRRVRTFCKEVIGFMKTKLALLLLISLVASAYPGFGQVYRQSATLLSSATTTVKSPWIDLEAIAPYRHTVAITVTGAPTGCTLSLEGAITEGQPTEDDDFDLSGGQTCTSSVMFHIANKPVRWIRANLSAISGGTAPTVTARVLLTR